MARPVARTIEAYSIHGHVRPGEPEEDLVDYTTFFNHLAQADPHDMRFDFSGDTVAIAQISRQEDQIALRFVTGRSDELPLVYDLSTAKAEAVNPGSDRFVVNDAWAIVLPQSRLLFLERRRPGVPIYQIERFLTRYGRINLNFGGISVSLNPVPSRSFAEEVAKFTRIREAAITLRRPNHSWTESAQGMLSQLGESNAAQVSIQLNADTGQSLSKANGLVYEVVELARHPINALKNAVIRGNRPDFDGERSVSLAKHTVKGSIRVDPMAGPDHQLGLLTRLASMLTAQIQDEEAEPGTKQQR